MAGTISDFLEDALLDHVFENTAYTSPTALYVALSTADPLDTGAGIAEPVGNGYARQSEDNWDVASSRASENTDALVWTASGGDWGSITHWALFDHVSAGNMLAHGDFASARTISDGNSLNVAAGGIDISFVAGEISDFLANELLDHFLMTGDYAQPTIYLALTTVTVTDSMTGTTITEPGSGAYARLAVPNWDASSAGATENTGIDAFTTATGSWGTILDVAIVDASSVGNLLAYSPIGTSVLVIADDIFRFLAGALDVTLV